MDQTNQTFEDFEITEHADEVEAGPVETPCEFLTGRAGSGKSWTIMERLRQNPNYALLTASTGISAVNLNTVTVHSALGFFDTASLKDSYLAGHVQRKLRKIHAEGWENLVLDEISMVSDEMLDTLWKVFADVNENLSRGERPIGLVLVGDLMQLAPIPEVRRRSAAVPWCFDAHCWPKFEANTTRLDKIYRQSDQRFMAALNFAREGRGAEMAQQLDEAGVKFESGVDIEFDGTTIVGKNDEVDRFNKLALDRVKGRLLGLPSRRWGQQRGEWKNIPEQVQLREGAYVMLLANSYDPEIREIIYANGDCGHIRSVEGRKVLVELVRNGAVVQVDTVVRSMDWRDKPEGFRQQAESMGGYLDRCHYNRKERRYVTGQVEYYPIRLAYASTVHKCQGLSLDRIQVDVRNWMFGSPAMVYVALSRCRTLEGLRLVGMKSRWAEQCKIDPRVARWM